MEARSVVEMEKIQKTVHKPGNSRSPSRSSTTQRLSGTRSTWSIYLKRVSQHCYHRLWIFPNAIYLPESHMSCSSKLHCTRQHVPLLEQFGFWLCSHMESTLRPQKKIVCVKEIVCVCDLCAVFGTFVMPIDEELAQASNARKPKNMVASPQYQHIYTMQLFTLLEQFNKGDRLEHRTQEFPKDLWKVKPFNHDAVSCKQGSRDCSQWKSCCETNRPQNLQRACKKLWYRERMRKWPYKALELRCAAWVPWLARLTRLASWRRRIHTCKPS